MYEGANFGQIVFATLLYCVAINIILQGILYLLSIWVNFTFRRKDVKLASNHANFFYSKVCKDEDAWNGFWFNAAVLFLASVVTQSAILYTSTFVIFMIVVCIILSFTFLPRLLVDFCKGLKYNKTTGEVDRIKELEKQVKELKESK